MLFDRGVEDNEFVGWLVDVVVDNLFFNFDDLDVVIFFSGGMVVNDEIGIYIMMFLLWGDK